MLIDAADSVLLVVDVQERLMPVIHQGEAIVNRLHKLSQAARLLDVPVLATEHHSRMLGVTVEPLRSSLGAIFKKMHFSATREPGFAQALPTGRKTFVLTGCEAHVCVLQTLLGLRQDGHRVLLVEDATGSRKPVDHQAALRRAAAAGAEIVTSEMAMFEWLETCEHPRFREVLTLIK